MSVPAPDSHALRTIEEEARKAYGLASGLQSHPSLDPVRIQAIVDVITRAYEQANAYLLHAPLLDPESARSFAHDARLAYDQALALRDSHRLPNPDVLLALAHDAQHAGEEADKFLHSSPLPSPEELDELAKRHQEFLDSLDSEYGPPSAKDMARAEKLIRKLRARG